MSRDMTRLSWRKASRSQANGQCLEVACVHDASWRKSSRSQTNGQCLEVAELATSVAVRDSKLPTSGDFPYLAMSPADWTGLITAIRTGDLTPEQS